MGHWQARVDRSLAGDLAIIATAGQVERELSPLLRLWQLRHGPADMVVIEHMAVYPDTDLGASGLNGLLRVQTTGGIALGALLSAFPSARYAIPTPHEWKGNVPKSAHHKQILARLTDECVAALDSVATGSRGHVLDAVGMALWAQGGRGAAAFDRREIMARARAKARKINRARRSAG